MNSIEICVVPSKSEELGIALVEAIAMGVPCVASNIEAPAKLVHYMNVGNLFSSEDSAALANEIKGIISEYNLRKRIAWKKRRTLNRRLIFQKHAENC